MKAERLWEVDSARGGAIIMMVVSNFLFDLFFFGSCPGCYSGFWFYFARATAILFVGIAGVSLTLSYSRAGGHAFPKYLKRGARIFGYGILVTAATWLFLGSGFVLFGILHLIGLSIILAYPLLKSRILSLTFGVAAVLAGFVLAAVQGPYWLVWLGTASQGFFSVDHTPVFPWLGVFLIGLFAGNSLFPKGRPRLRLPDVSNTKPIRLLTLLGRRSLFIYLVHQPVLVGILLLSGVASF